MISVAVLTPGITGRPTSWQRRTTAALRPGDTTNLAPALERLVDLARR